MIKITTNLVTIKKAYKIPLLKIFQQNGKFYYYKFLLK